MPPAAQLRQFPKKLLRFAAKVESREWTATFHPTRDYLVLLGWNKGEILTLSSNLETTPYFQFGVPAPRARFWALAFAPELDLLVTTGENLPLEVRQAASGEIIDRLGLSKEGYSSVLAVGSFLYAKPWLENPVEVYDLAQRRKVASLQQAMDKFQLHPEGRLIAAAVQCDALTPITYLSHNPLRQFREVYILWHTLTALAFRPQGDLLCTFGYSSRHAYLNAFDLPSRTRRYKLSFDCVFEPGTYSISEPLPLADNLVFSADGQRLLYPTHKGTLKEIDALSGATICETTIHEGRVEAIDIRHDLGLLATADDRGEVKLWDYEPARPTAPPTPGITAQFSDMAEFKPDDADPWDWKETKEPFD